MVTTSPEQVRLCSTCGLRPAQPGQRKCKDCHAEYMREWRLKATTIRLSEENYEYLRRRAFDEGGTSSMSRLINQAVDAMRDGDVSRETKREHR